MSTQRSHTRNPRPRTFTPPPTRAPRRKRAPLGWPAPGWRERVVPAIARGFCAVVFGGFGAIAARFGDAALTVTSLGLAGFVAAIAYVAVKMQAEFTVGTLVADVIALAVLPATLWIASGVMVADAQFGGNAGHFVLSILAVLSLTLVILAVAAVVNISAPRRAALGGMAGAFSVIAIIGGGSRFSSGSLPDGMSLAWMAAAALTLADGIVNPRARDTLRVVGVSAYAGIVVVLGMTDNSLVSGNTSNSVVGVLVALVIAALVIVLPRWTEWLRPQLVDDAAQYRFTVEPAPPIRPVGERRP